ncbi:MAG: hypothetical protein JWQ27_2384 [Ferruginibacter sp.]|nr:hypothetical protein [Ferruginibacter sp.]
MMANNPLIQRNKILIITILVFFLLVNSRYFWEGQLGFFAVPFFIVLAAVYVGLIVSLLRQCYLRVADRFSDKRRLMLIALLLFVICITYCQPSGLIDFDKFDGKDVLVAEREGAANCLTTVRLKEDYTFHERIGCFGIWERRGTYRVVNDTIYFEHILPGRQPDDNYAFAVIKPSKFHNSKILGNLVMYSNVADTGSTELWITNNNLKRLEDKKGRR